MKLCASGDYPMAVMQDKEVVVDRVEHLCPIDFVGLSFHIHLCWIKKPN